MLLQQQHLYCATSGYLACEEPSWDDPALVGDQQITWAQEIGEVGELAMLQTPMGAVNDE